MTRVADMTAGELRALIREELDAILHPSVKIESRPVELTVGLGFRFADEHKGADRAPD